MAWSKRTSRNRPDTKEKILLLSQELTTGSILCIDPSIGSSSSSCGYALFVTGELKECGTIEVKLSGNHSQRLHQLCETLRTDFTRPDVLIVEQINLWRGGRSQTALVLNRVIGAVLSVWSMENVLEIPPPLWHSFTEVVGYEKSDSNDAVMLGICALEVCRGNPGNVKPKPEKKARKTKIKKRKTRK